MEKKTNKNKGVVKGGPSGFVISLMVHAAAFLLAGLLVVFSVTRKPEQKFTPPPAVDRPKMKLKKPKVKVKKTSKPASPTRIMAKVTKADMPELNLPEIGGTGSGFGGVGELGGFDIMPDLNEMASPFGRTTSIGSDLEGTFVDFNRTRSGKVTGMDSFNYLAELVRFNKNGWRESSLAKYFRSPKKLYSSTVMIPPLMSPLGPSAFDEPDNMSAYWAVVYRGQLVYPEDIAFRFVGNSDNVMAVRVNDKVVLDASREDRTFTPPLVDTSWLPDSPDHRKWYHCHDYSAVGNLIELKAGEPQSIEIVIGELAGVLFNANLWVMVEGVDYPTGENGSPILPVFQTDVLTRGQKNMLYRGMPNDQISFDGPVFNDYVSGGTDVEPAVEPAVAEPASDAVADQTAPEAAETQSGMRMWLSSAGKSFEAELATIIGKDAVFKTPKGRQVRMPIDELSAEDRHYISLSNPPELDIDLNKSSRQKIFKYDADGVVGCLEFVFSPKIKVKDKKYNHPLRVEYWVIGSEISGSAFILLDKGEGTFNPADLDGDTFTMSGRTVPLYDWVLEHIYNERRGERYKGFLVNVVDERGEIIAQRSSPTWLAKNLDELRLRELGSFFDDTCAEVWPKPLDAPANN